MSFAAVREPDTFQGPVDRCEVDAVDPAQDLQVATAAEPGNRVGVSTIAPTVRTTPGRPLGIDGAEHGERPGAGRYQPQQAPDRGGLARAVGTEEPEDPALGNLQIQPVHGGRSSASQTPILLAEALDLDHGRHARTLRYP